MNSENKKYVFKGNNHVINLTNDDIVVILEEKPTWFKTSSTGKEILEQFKTPKTEGEIINYLVEEYDIEKEIISDIVKNTINKFVEQKVLVSIDDESDLNESFPEIGDIKLQQLWLNITDKCNLACKHCFAIEQGHNNFMPLRKALKLIRQAHRMNLEEIIISGGEPTLHPDLGRILQEASKDEGCKVKLITNGNLSKTKEGQEKIMNWIPFIDDIQVSIDGIDEETNDKIRSKGSFEMACNMIKLVSGREDIKVGISVTPTPENIDSMDKLYKFAINLGVDYIHLNRAKNPVNRGYNCNEEFLSAEFARRAYSLYDDLIVNYTKVYEDMRGLANVKYPIIDSSFDPATELVTVIKKNRCSAGFLTLAVTPEGDVYPCAALVNNLEMKIGNVFDKSLLEISLDARRKMQELFSVDKSKKCSMCHFRYFCGGGCRATAESIEQEDSMCDVIQERFIGLLERISLPIIKTYCGEENQKKENSGRRLVKC